MLNQHRMRVAAAATVAVLMAAATLPSTPAPKPISEKKLASDAATWKELIGDRDLDAIIKLHVDELKAKVVRSKGQFNSGRKKAIQAGHVFAILGNAGTVMNAGDEAKPYAALRDAGLALAKAGKEKNFDGAKSALETIGKFPKSIEPSDSVAPMKWADTAPIDVIMEVVSRVDSDVNKALKDKEFSKLAREVSVRTRLLACLAVVVRELKAEEAWQGFCDDMRESSLALSKQFMSKNMGGAKTANDAVQKSCKMCHDKYNIVE